MFECVVFLSVLVGSCSSLKEGYTPLQSALPSPVTYFHLPEAESTPGDTEKSSVPIIGDRDPRFGVQLGYGNDIQGYSGGQVLGNYTPLKIDLGGLVLGTVIGLGAVLLVPKILHLISSPHHPPGPYARSDEVSILSNIGNVIAKIDETLQEHEIDTMACLQKAACSLISSTTAKDVVGNTRNPILNFVIDGSKLKSALDKGLKGENCAAAYPQCSVSSNSMLKENKL